VASLSQTIVSNSNVYNTTPYNRAIFQNYVNTVTTRLYHVYCAVQLPVCLASLSGR